ncbi:MAG: translation elongation factor-like protein [Dehalococcoidia bacterium]|nr:translation elongation factor-like protein [Dehalococcoidia bacterium]
MPEIEIGKISAFFAKPVVAVIDLSNTLCIGDKIHVKGHTTNLEFTVESMQIDNVNVTEGKSSDSIGVKVPDRVRHGDTAFKVIG